VQMRGASRLRLDQTLMSADKRDVAFFAR